ncbi:TIGR04206 family protein [Haloferacaceae archaeon DSL9]
MARSTPDLVAVASIGSVCLLPWLVIGGESGATFVMAWGLLALDPLFVFPLPSYLDATRGFGQLPSSLQAWPVSAGIYGVALASATSGLVFDREDRRVTAGSLLLSGIGGVFLWVGFLGRGISGAVPVAPLALWTIAWWFYGPALRRLWTIDR